MSLKSAFASKLYHKRRQRRLTQAQVANAVSISVRWYQLLEKGVRLPSSAVTFRLLIFLEIDPQELRGEVTLHDPDSVPSR